MNRLIHALKYYKLLKIANDTSTHKIFTEFCCNVYVKVLDDYNHILMTHSNHLQEIYKQVINSEHFGPSCSMDKCIIFKRHYNKDRRSNGYGKISQRQKQQQDPLFLFYRELFDSAHHYIYHLFHVGLRQRPQQFINDGDDSKEEEFDFDIDNMNNQQIDYEFQKKLKYIKQQSKKLKSLSIDRFDDKQSKYILRSSQVATGIIYIFHIVLRVFFSFICIHNIYYTHFIMIR